MPIYEYECPKCGRFEVVQKASEKPVKADPACSCADCPRAAKRVISAAAFHLKGSGWYKTDYASKSGAVSSSGSSGSSGSSSSADDSGSDKKKKKDGETKEKKPAACGSGCGCH
jgi:putative FmdB family regulatory protein